MILLVMLVTLQVEKNKIRDKKATRVLVPTYYFSVSLFNFDCTAGRSIIIEVLTLQHTEPRAEQRAAKHERKNPLDRYAINQAAASKCCFEGAAWIPTFAPRSRCTNYCYPRGSSNSEGY